jgi:hypothetical protein
MTDVGKIYKKDTLFLRVAVGKATKKTTGIVYQMATIANTGVPVIQSEKTGQWFTLGWDEIISLAINAGIDKILPDL